MAFRPAPPIVGGFRPAPPIVSRFGPGYDRSGRRDFNAFRASGFNPLIAEGAQYAAPGVVTVDVWDDDSDMGCDNASTPASLPTALPVSLAAAPTVATMGGGI